MWRTVSFVDRIEVDFDGNLFNQAITLADIDNDKANELIVGNTEGDLAIFKGTNRTPWKVCTDLGMVTCIGVGDVYGKGKNILVVLTAEGWCYLFELKGDSSSGEIGKDNEEELDKILKPSFTQHLPANGKVLLIDDIDGDGQTEVVIGYSDRVVRCFTWSVSQEHEAEQPSGKFIQSGKWQLTGQIGSLTVNICEDGNPELLVSQPGGTYVTLYHTTEAEDANVHKFENECLGISRTRNTSISTEIVGSIKKGTSGEKLEAGTFYALCTLDGTLLLVENKQILWSLQVDHQLFSLTKLDITGNGKEEVVCCAWDGQTYVVNHTRDVVRYHFEENVKAFTAGQYSVTEHENVPCFVYATFNNKIYIYYNISLPQVESTNLIEVMDRIPETHQLLQQLNIIDPDTKNLRELYHWCLYGKKT